MLVKFTICITMLLTGELVLCADFIKSTSSLNTLLGLAYAMGFPVGLLFLLWAPESQKAILQDDKFREYLEFESSRQGKDEDCSLKVSTSAIAPKQTSA